MIRNEIGECAITCGGVRYEFRPSFKNIRKICHPNDLASFYSDLAGVIDSKISISKSLHMPGAVSAYTNDVREKSAKVLLSCCDTDCANILDNDDLIKTNVMQQIALSLLTHGLIGVDKSETKSTKEKRSEIDVYEYADIAEAHLGIAYPLSENLTKTELDRKMRIKFPDDKNSKSNGAPSDEEYYQAMAMLDKIDAKRAK